MKQYLLLFFLMPWLFACESLTDNEVKALKCELWRESGSVLNRQIYRDLTGKSECITTSDFGEMLAIKGSKRISIPCDPKQQKFFLQEVNLICDALLNLKIADQMLITRGCQTLLSHFGRGKQKKLLQDVHLMKKCKLWGRMWQDQAGWVPEAG